MGMNEANQLTTPEKFKGGEWKLKIDRARQARATGQETRKGRPPAFNSPETRALLEARV